MDKETENAVAIAVINEQISGIREQHKAHNEQTQDKLNSMEHKIDELTAIMNRGKGAYAASMAFAGVIGAAILAGVDFLSKVLHR